MDEAPDFDDLMEDAMNEEEPPPYEDDFDMMMMEEEEGTESNVQPMTSPEVAVETLPTTTINAMDRDDDDPANDNDDDASVTSHQSHFTNNASSFSSPTTGERVVRPATRKDAFSFERYA